jgi:four helix bundle protein
MRRIHTVTNVKEEGGRMKDERRTGAVSSPGAIGRTNHDESDGKRRELRKRTKEYALRVIRVYAALPKTTEAQVLGKQALRSGTSVGAHYREANRAKSDADFINKVEGALQELDETAYWLELLAESGVVAEDRLTPLLKETDELLAIFVTMVTRLKRKAK